MGPPCVGWSAIPISTPRSRSREACDRAHMHAAQPPANSPRRRRAGAAAIDHGPAACARARARASAPSSFALHAQRAIAIERRAAHALERGRERRHRERGAEPHRRRRSRRPASAHGRARRAMQQRAAAAASARRARRSANRAAPRLEQRVTNAWTKCRCVSSRRAAVLGDGPGPAPAALKSPSRSAAPAAITSRHNPSLLPK